MDVIRGLVMHPSSLSVHYGWRTVVGFDFKLGI